MKKCIVTLAILTSPDLNGLIDNLNLYFIPTNPEVDLLVFIEDKDKLNVNLVNHYYGGRTIFHVISNLTLKDNGLSSIEIPESIFGFGIGYRMMCRFFSGELFKILKTYDYTHYLRLDTDSRFLSPVYDLFTDFISQNLSYGYISIFNEAYEVTHDLLREVKRYIINNNISCNRYLLDEYMDQLNMCYYNNFEIVKIEEFTSDTYFNLYTYLDKEINGFLRYRWGDAFYRFVYVNLFIDQSKIKYMSNIKYFHKFILNNSPFQFVNWNVAQFRKDRLNICHMDT